MESRERMLGAIYRRPIDRIPMMESYWGSVFEKWHREGLPENVTPGNAYEFFKQEPMNVTYVDWSFQYPTGVAEETDEYIITVSADNVKTKVLKNSVTTLELSDYSITCKEDWEVNKSRLIFNEKRINIEAAKQNYENTKDRYVQVYMEPCMGFEKFKYCMGTEGIILACAEEPEMVKEMTEYTEQLAIDGLEYSIGKGIKFDIGYITEDMGFSNGPFFSPQFYREIIMPSHRRWCDLLHSKGMKSMLHTCGDNRKLLPLFVEAGFDILNPLEQKAGMNIFDIKRDYGEVLTIWGGIDVKTISFGTEQQLHDEIKAKVLCAKQGGGYIFGSDHSIPDNVHYKMYEKMLEWALEYGKY